MGRIQTCGITDLSLALLGSFALDLLQLPLQFGRLVFIVAVIIAAAGLVVFVRVVGIDVSRLFQDAPPFCLGVFLVVVIVSLRRQLEWSLRRSSTWFWRVVRCRRRPSVALGVVGSLGSQELGAQVAHLVVGIATLPGLPGTEIRISPVCLGRRSPSLSRRSPQRTGT